MSDGCPTRAQSFLVDLLTCVTVLDPDGATAALEAGGHGGAAATPADLARLVRQASLTHADRTSLLVALDGGLPGVPAEAVAAAAEAVRSTPPRLPAAEAVTLGPLDPALTSAMQTLFHLDATVAAPWTLIGGLMTLLHCTEHGVPFSRPTGDADIAVGVFTHRGALWTLTQTLRDLGFEDRTTAPLTGGEQLSYRWADGAVQIDVAVPPKVNAQRARPLTASGRPAVELPATQQALRRTERAPVTLADGTAGAVRRPDLLAALVIKAQAALSDRRDTDRHQEDLVSLVEAMSISGLHLAYRDQLRPKDARRLAGAAQTLPAATWRRAGDPVAARAALDFLLDQRPG